MTIGSFVKQLAAEGANDAMATMLDLRGIEAIAREFENMSAFFDGEITAGNDPHKFRERVKNFKELVSRFSSILI